MKSHSKIFLSLIALGVLLFISACSSYNYFMILSNKSKEKEQSIEVYTFGVSSDDLDDIKAMSYDEFWKKTFASNGNFPDSKKVFSFSPDYPNTQGIDYDDKVWDEWNSNDADYLCIAVYSPNAPISITSKREKKKEKDKGTDWRIFISLTHRNWWGLSSEYLKISIHDGKVIVD